jgi:hypothetical protein
MKLEQKLKLAHPDLPVAIINNEYGSIFSHPDRTTGKNIGRIITSLSAIACLRAQWGVAPQLKGHMFGLKKVWEDGSWAEEQDTGPEEAVKWLASDEGCIWVLTKVDELVEALGGIAGSVFTPPKAKL